MTHAAGNTLGKVFLVGAGPGDPGLITERGAQCLGLAGLVLCDYLVNPLLLDYARPIAERVCLGHAHVGREMIQQETIRCALATVAETIEKRQIRPPAVIMVGEVVALAPSAYH
jgi:siroheme synthase